MKKVLFPDIDSVLNIYQDYLDCWNAQKAGGDGTVNGRFIVSKEAGNIPVCTVKLNRLKSIVKETNCDIVGISSWFSSRLGAKEVSRLFKINIMEVGYSTCGSQGRYIGCRDWLKDHPDYTYAVVLDDIPMDSGSGLVPIHVQPFREGLTEELKDKCIEILNKEYSEWIK